MMANEHILIYKGKVLGDNHTLSEEEIHEGFEIELKKKFIPPIGGADVNPLNPTGGGIEMPCYQDPLRPKTPPREGAFEAKKEETSKTK